MVEGAHAGIAELGTGHPRAMPLMRVLAYTIMSTSRERHISVNSRSDFNRLLASFANEGYSQAGIGVVLIPEGQFQADPHGHVEALLKYVPHGSEDLTVPVEALAMLDTYDPDREFVLVIQGKSDRAMCLHISMDDSPPLVSAHHSPFSVGAVLHLKTAIDEVQPGYYVFMGEHGIHMRLSPLVLDDDEGDLSPDGQVVSVHSDFCEVMEKTGMAINPRWLP